MATAARRTAGLHVSRAMQAARRRSDLTFRAGSAGGPKPGRDRCYLELGRRLERAYNCAYHDNVVRFEWDPKKAAANYAKHGVHFADAVGVFEDDLAITIEDQSTDEERFKTLGTDFLDHLLVVVYTYRGEVIRLITARNANAVQRKAYERKRR